MFWSYQRFQKYVTEPEKPAPAPPRTVLFAPSRRVYDTFGAEVARENSNHVHAHASGALERPAMSEYALSKTHNPAFKYAARAAERASGREQHVPYYSVANNV